AIRWGAANHATATSHALLRPSEPRSSGRAQHEAAPKAAARPPAASSNALVSRTRPGGRFPISSPMFGPDARGPGIMLNSVAATGSRPIFGDPRDPENSDPDRPVIVSCCLQYRDDQVLRARGTAPPPIAQRISLSALR